MFEKLFSSLRADNNNEPHAARRKYTRRDCDKCVGEINGRTYPVENWSLGGILINSDERSFGVDETVDVNLKFKLRDEILQVPHRARVVRKARNKVAFQFDALPRTMRGQLQKVVDDYVTSEFANSQMA